MGSGKREREPGMSAEAILLVRSWQVGNRTCTMTVPRPQPGQPVHVALEWDPAIPERLSLAERAQYRRGRDAAVAEIAQALDLNVAVLDL